MSVSSWIILLFAAVLGVMACSDAGTSAPQTAVGTEPSQVEQPLGGITDAFGLEPEPGANYGAGVAAQTQPVTFASFVERMSDADELADVVVQGKVVEVCQKKGCWMTLAAADASPDSEVTVRFKDYGFFMPKTLPGSEVVVKGTAKRVVTPVEDLRHYAEDAGETAEEIAAITEPREEVEFIATGVRVL